MIVHLFNRQKALKISLPQARAIVKQVIEEEGETCHEVSLYFVDSSTICDLHQQFFDDPSPTDCISFPMDEDKQTEDRILGEVFVCPEVAIKYANQHQCDVYEEVTLYMIHGLLHLMGYDDIEEKERKKMRQAEARHFQKLKQLNLMNLKKS